MVGIWVHRPGALPSPRRQQAWLECAKDEGARAAASLPLAQVCRGVPRQFLNIEYCCLPVALRECRGQIGNRVPPKFLDTFVRFGRCGTAGTEFRTSSSMLWSLLEGVASRVRVFGATVERSHKLLDALGCFARDPSYPECALRHGRGFSIISDLQAHRLRHHRATPNVHAVHGRDEPLAF